MDNNRWIRLPRTGRCPETGLSRAHYYALIKAGKIKSACIRQPGKITGVRLIWLPSVMEYIERHVDGNTGRHRLKKSSAPLCNEHLVPGSNDGKVIQHPEEE